LTEGSGSGRPKVEFVRASEADLVALVKLREAFWHDQIGRGLIDVPPLDSASLESATLSILKRPRTVVLMCMKEGRPVAYAYGQTRLVPGAKQSMVSMIEELFVEPDCGVSTAAFNLIQKMNDELRAHGSERIQAKILHDNLKSQKFFALCGFKPNLIYYEYAGTDGDS
jgi:L-amino acid N-acyltransferase YncA